MQESFLEAMQRILTLNSGGMLLYFTLLLVLAGCSWTANRPFLKLESPPQPPAPQPAPAPAPAPPRPTPAKHGSPATILSTVLPWILAEAAEALSDCFSIDSGGFDGGGD